MAGLDFDAVVDAMVERRRNEQEIHCPHCGAKYDFTSDDVGMVTYWGEDGPQELDCGSCEKTFFANESVYRTFTVGKTWDEANE